ncbi:DUF4333 domain-containing protein [Mycobacterium sp. MS1601]|uniref:DUF4333 domain-containing protein n=1 Tax=Mycobacterium sp. MS1601 TaxID=1936029 RepID=UPI00178CD9B2|nr:DUF4333 domain-containing protein [Mycobacterium sp. MS1601]
MRTLVYTLSTATVVGLSAVGCSFSFNSGPPTVGKGDLESDISSRLAEADQKPQSVVCSADLEGVVGKTTTCEVVLSDTNAIEPVVEVTKVEDTTVSYEMTPALSQAQLEKAVANLVTESAGEEVAGVTCDGGLLGEEGNETNCSMQLGGEPLDTVVTVTTVNELLMNFEVNQV